MKWYFRDQHQRMFGHLQHFKSVKMLAARKFELREKVTEIVVDIPYAPEHFKDLLDHYRIFPENIVVALCEFEAEKRPMRVGDVIVQQVYIPPIPVFSLSLIMGVRITAVIDEEHRKGFTYKTLRGHVEKGVSTFTFEPHPNGTLFRIHTFSRTAFPVVGVIARPYQFFVTRRAMCHVKKQLLQTASETSFQHAAPGRQAC